MTIMEAFALSRPVITTAIAGIPELVDDQCGWVVTAGSVEALVKAMRSALHAPAEELAKKGAVGRERVLRLHSVRSTAADIVRAIEARSA
jgi:glycosyltransferase involved in cell wall biosynthesis